MKISSALAWSSAALSLAGLAVQCINLRYFPALRPRQESAGSVVACLAARDEAGTIERCVRGLLAQPEVEAVVICDDRSSDATPELIERMMERDARVWRARLPNVQPGSKRTALIVAAARACASDVSYLLFTDADVVWESGSVGALLELAATARADAVSAWPRVRMRSLVDVLFAPLVPELLLQALPMWRERDSRCAAGNGQAFLVARDAYVGCGGHVRTGIVEDVALARQLRAQGFRVVLASCANVCSVDGYSSTLGALNGLGRSLYAGGGLAACIAYAIWHALVVAALFTSKSAPLPSGLAIVASTASRALQRKRMREPASSLLLAPLSHAVGALGALRAGLLGKAGRLSWRGRRLPA